MDLEDRKEGEDKGKDEMEKMMDEGYKDSYEDSYNDGYDDGYNDGYKVEHEYNDGYDKSGDDNDDGLYGDGWKIEYDNYEPELKIFSVSVLAKLQALTNRISSLSKEITFTSHQLNKWFGTSIIHNKFTIATFDTTASGVVYCEWFHLHKVLGISLPPPKTSHFNVPCLCLHTGLRHGPRASNLHKITIFTCGSRHRPRAPDQTVDSFWTKLALAEGATAVDTVPD